MSSTIQTSIIGGLSVDRLGPPDGPLVVLLHGGGQTRHSWSGTARQLAMRGYQVHNFDARGHGDSGWAAGGHYSLDSRAEDLRAVLDGRQPFALIGASLGGASAIHAVAQGLHTTALVLVDIAPFADPVGVERVKDFMRSGMGGFATIEDAADAVAAYNLDRKRPANPRGLTRNLRRGADGRLYWHWDPAILVDEPGTMLANLDSSSRKLAKLEMATLLVRGLHSDVVSEATVTEFRQVLPTLEVIDVADAGHMVAGDRNDVFTAAVLQFLDHHR